MTDFDDDREFATRALSGLDEIEPSAGLLRRVAELPLTHPRTRRPGAWPFESLWMPLLAGALAAALGVTTGWATLDDDATTTAGATTQPIVNEQGVEAEGVDDLLALAWGSDAPILDEQPSPETP